MIGSAVRFRTAVKVNKVMKMTREKVREKDRAMLGRWPERDEVIEGQKERRDRGPKG
jgi:hypothetical protein